MTALRQRAGRRLPTGTVTFLFTDIEGSTRLLRRLGNDYGQALADSRRLLRAAFAAHGGHEVDTQGDSFFVAFPAAGQALAAAADAQRALAGHPWPPGAPLRVRMGVHSGEATTTDEGYVGLTVHRGARIAAAASGGQVLVSAATAALVADDLPDGLTLHDLGSHQLRDFPHPAHLHQLVVPGLPHHFPPPRAGSPVVGLPAPAGPFLGRDADVAAVAAMLRESPTRLVTLTGPGGIGKTRLAVETARAVAADFPGGVVLVPMAAVSDPGLLLGTVADRLGVRREPGADVLEVLGDTLGNERLLLVLDNLEQVVAAAPDIAALLDAAPGAVVLATSRTLLRLRVERRYELAPLEERDAVTLFEQRAAAVRPGFALDDDEGRAAVAEICRRLDGLPLAVELAAARVRLLSPEALLERLRARLDVVGSGPADLPERQRTLRATMDWSFALLQPHEQVLFTRLGVFAGPWTLDAADAVCRRPGEPDVLDTVAGLVDASLVRTLDEPDADPRLLLLETVRAYAAERLAGSDERAATEARHTAWVEQLIDPLTHGRAREFRDALRRFDRYRADVRAAVLRAVEDPDVTATSLLIRAALPYVTRRDLEREARRWIERAACRAAGAPDDVRGRLLVMQSLLAGVFAELSSVPPLLQEAGRLLPDDADHAIDQALAATARFYAAIAEEDLAAADRAVQEADARFRAVGLDIGVAFVAVFAGDLALARGDLDEAERHYSAALDLGDRMGDDALVGQALSQRALVLLARGDAEGARRAVLDGAAANRRGGQPTSIAFSLEGLAAVALAEGRAALAAEALGAAGATRARSAIPVSPILTRLVADLAAHVRAQLGEEQYASACEKGCRCPAREALDLVLDELTADPTST